MREYRYVVDREGRVLHDGTEIVDPLVLRFFLRAMRRTPDGRYLVVCQGEHNWFEPHDTPFVVQRLGLHLEDGRLHAVELHFVGDYREPLDPRSLETEGGHLFCRVRQDAFRARFGRVAMQQIAPFLAEDAAGPALLIAGDRHPIRAPGAPPRRLPMPGRASCRSLLVSYPLKADRLSKTPSHSSGGGAFQ